VTGKEGEVEVGGVERQGVGRRREMRCGAPGKGNMCGRRRKRKRWVPNCGSDEEGWRCVGEGG
jgi:hypothetical protein